MKFYNSRHASKDALLSFTTLKISLKELLFVLITMEELLIKNFLHLIIYLFPLSFPSMAINNAMQVRLWNFICERLFPDYLLFEEFTDHVNCI